MIKVFIASLALVTSCFGLICERKDTKCLDIEECWPEDDPNARGYQKDVAPSDIWYSVPITDAFNNYDAYCLDGSMPHYYFRPGYIDGDNDGTTKYYAYLEGGGWCAGIGTQISSSMDTCDHRATTSLGSTTNDAPTINTNGQYLSNNKNENPVMYNWNGLYIRYCDGASYSGNNDDPIPVTINGKDTYIYYRGYRIIRGIIESILNNASLATPTEFILTGCSAGGLGTFLHTDFFIDTIVDAVGQLSVQPGAMPDSGYFMEYEATPTPNFVGGMQWIYPNQNVSAAMDPNCLSAYSGEEWNCIFAQNVSPFIKNRIFPLQSQYDSWQLPNILGTTTNNALVNQYGLNLTDSFKKQVLSNSQNGCYLSSCYYHCNDWDTIHIDGSSMATSMYNWYYGISNSENNQFIQDQTYPCSTCCS